MRRTMIGFAVPLALGLVALLAVGLAQGSTLVYSLGVNPAIVAAEVKRGERACQAPILVPRGTEFDSVGFVLASSGRPGSKLHVEVLNDSTGRRIASGTLPAGYRDPPGVTEHVVQVGDVRTDDPLWVCVTNAGPRRVSMVGQDGVASTPTSATLERKGLPTDLTINLRAEEQSLIALLPDMADRASRFRAGWIVPPVYFVLGVLILVGAPVLLARGLGRAAAADAGR
jgi:hypothetical protein